MNSSLYSTTKRYCPGTSYILLLLFLVFTLVQSNSIIRINSYAEFEDVSSASTFVLFNLFAPWCGHCKKLDPILKAVADTLHRSQSPVRIAYIDVSTPDGELIAQELGIDGYPSLVPFEQGKRLPEYAGARKQDALLAYLSSRIDAPRVPWLDSAAELDALLDRIDSRGVFSEEGLTVLSVALALLKPSQSGTDDTPTREVEEKCSEDSSSENCQAPHASTDADDLLKQQVQYEMMTSAADKFDLTLFAASSSPELFERYNVQETSLLVFTPATVQSDTSKTHVAQLQMPGNSSRLLRDVVTHSLPAVLSYSKAIHPFLRYLPCRSHVLVFMPSDSSSHVHKYLESLTERLAALYRGRLQFISVAAHHMNLLQYFELAGSDKDIPSIVIADMSEPTNMRKYVYPHSLTTSGKLEDQNDSSQDGSSDEDDSTQQKLRDFFDEYLRGTRRPTLRSDATNTVSSSAARGIVNILHGSTFQSMVMDDDDSDFFVYFTAPWCGFCKAVEPVVEELATYYKLDRRMKIGKIDMIKNDIAHPNVHVRAYPSFYLFLGEDKLNPVPFDGERSALQITQFIADERTKYRTRQRKPTI